MRGDGCPPATKALLGRFRHGPGVCKVDWALSGPVPWTASVCRQAGTVHVGGSFAEVAESESEVAAGRHALRPYCLVVQPGVADPTRAPAGHETLWAYCHVPRGSDVDMTVRIEAQIERFAPGFKDLVLARSTMTAIDTEAHNPNYVGGDISGGAGTLRQTIFRPAARWNPVQDRCAGALHLLRLHASGRRRARDVRGGGGPHRARRPEAGKATVAAVRTAWRCYRRTPSWLVGKRPSWPVGKDRDDKRRAVG